MAEGHSPHGKGIDSALLLSALLLNSSATAPFRVLHSPRHSGQPMYGPLKKHAKQGRANPTVLCVTKDHTLKSSSVSVDGMSHFSVRTRLPSPKGELLKSFFPQPPWTRRDLGCERQPNSAHVQGWRRPTVATSKYQSTRWGAGLLGLSSPPSRLFHFPGTSHPGKRWRRHHGSNSVSWATSLVAILTS